MKKKKINEADKPRFSNELMALSNGNLSRTGAGFFSTANMAANEIITVDRIPMLLFCINISNSTESILLHITRNGITVAFGPLQGVYLSQGAGMGTVSASLWVEEGVLHIRNNRSLSLAFRSFGICL